MSQELRIIEYMKKYGSITQLQAYAELGVMRLPSRIFYIKRMGYNIITEMIEVENRFGENCRVARYYLKEQKK